VRAPRLAAARTIAAVAGLALLAGCGGGGSGDGNGGPGPLSITSDSASDGVVGTAYSASIVATGGQGARTFSISAGELPAGLSLSNGGVISGTPAGPPGTAGFSVTVTDAATPPATDTQSLTLDIVEPLAIETTVLAGTAVGAAYDATLEATGGTPPYAFSVSDGSLPEGLALGTDGGISGPATDEARTQTFTVQVSDSSDPALSASRQYTVGVALEITSAALPDAFGGVPYDVELQSQGGTLPLAWARTAGALPAGLSGPAAATGRISGTPDFTCAPSTAFFTAQVTDSSQPPVTDTQAGLSVNVGPADLRITTSTLPNGTVGVPYSAFVEASGGVPPYAFANSDILPTPFGPIDPVTGEISGTPDTGGAVSGFEVTVTDGCGTTDSRALSITINGVSLGRNDSVAGATPLGNGSYRASISPSGHPNSVFAPDEDYYAITTTRTSTVVVDILAQNSGSPIDTVMEIVGANGSQLGTCVAPGYVSPCEHDDDVLGEQLDSHLEIRVTGATTFYVHIVDFRGDARPDLIYTLNISGVN
jgi:hypothetical protein